MIKKKLCVALEKYTGADGKEKTKWQQIGAIHTTRDGSREYMTLEPWINIGALPKSGKDGDNRVYVSMFDADRQSDPGAYQKQSTPKSDPMNEPLNGPDDDDIPF